jgi:hypothetical protein
MKEKKLMSHGFSRIINGIKFTVFFEYFGDVTRCTLIELLYKGEWEYEDEKIVYFGVAKVNKEEGDVYNRVIGENIAFEKAICKWLNHQDTEFMKKTEKFEKNLHNVEYTLSNRLQKIQEDKNEGEEIPF